ncbi:MAG: DUF2794 domain-containing protein [Pseudomonadota bacterium]
MLRVVPPGPAAVQPAPDQVTFDRKELSALLTVYGRFVAAGEWRDYGMTFAKDHAVFAVFRRAAENPIYRIEKRPKQARAQGQYSIAGIDGRVLKRGADLRQVLRVLDKKLIRAVED